MPLLLSRAEVQDLMDFDTAIDVTENVLREQSKGGVVPRAPIHVVIGRGGMRMVYGGIPSMSRMGARIGSISAQGDHSVAVLFDSSNGEMLAIMAYPFGTYRTGASIALSVREMARKNAKTLAVIGSGRNALNMIQGTARVRDVDRITVFSRTAEHRERFAQRVAEAVGIETRAAASADEAIAGADIVLVSTDSLTPVLYGAQLSPGVHVSSMGKPSELDESAFLKADRVAITSMEHELHYYDHHTYEPMLRLIDHGRRQPSDILPFADIVAHRLPGRVNDQEITLYHESQGGYGDVAIAAHIFEKALSRGIGMAWDLGG